jgi:hypothetical protein
MPGNGACGRSRSTGAKHAKVTEICPRTHPSEGGVSAALLSRDAGDGRESLGDAG